MSLRKITSYMMVLAGVFLILNSYAGITGAVIGYRLVGEIWSSLSLILIIGGILMATSAERVNVEGKKKTGELEIILADNSHGQNTVPDRDYIMVDVDGAFGDQSKPVTLGDVRKELHRLGRIDKEYAEAVRGAYGPKVVSAYEEGDDTQRKVARSFLDAFGIEVKEDVTKEEYKLGSEERRELFEAFRDWRGLPDRKQREVLRQYGLEFNSKHKGPHAYVEFVGKETSEKYTFPHSKGDIRVGLNIARDIIKMIEENRQRK